MLPSQSLPHWQWHASWENTWEHKSIRNFNESGLFGGSSSEFCTSASPLRAHFHGYKRQCFLGEESLQIACSSELYNKQSEIPRSYKSMSIYVNTSFLLNFYFISTVLYSGQYDGNAFVVPCLKSVSCFSILGPQCCEVASHFHRWEQLDVYWNIYIYTYFLINSENQSMQWSRTIRYPRLCMQAVNPSLYPRCSA